MKRAFTLLEMVVVITITAIIIAPTFQLLTNLYNSYRYMRDINYLDGELTTASLIIEKLIEQRVVGSIIESNETNFSMISGKFFFNHNQTIQWIGRAYDSFLGGWDSDRGENVPAWSGFLDLSLNHTDTILDLDDSNISIAKEIIYYLSNGKIDITDPNSPSPPALFFKTMNDPNRNGYGWKNSILNEEGREYAYIGYFDRNSSDGNLTFRAMPSHKFSDNVSPLIIVEQYFLSWTAYGIEFINENGKERLYLYYNYRPWNGEKMEENGTKTLLLDNIEEYFYSATGTTFKFRICISNGLEGDSKIVFCREFLVY